MSYIRSQNGNASLASVFALLAVLGLYVAHDQKKTNNLRAEVQGSTLSSIAKQANTTALSRTRSLLIHNSSGTAAVKVQNKSFAAVSGTGYQINQGALVLQAPDPRSQSWMNASAGSQLSSRVTIEKVELDAANAPKALIALAETTVTSGQISKTLKTRARFDLLALNPSPPSSSGSNPGSSSSSSPGSPASTPAPGSASSSGSTTVASNRSNPCGTALAPGNSASSSQTGANTSNSTAQGQNTGTSANTTANSASGCSMSQTGNNTASANSSGTGSQVTAKNSTSTTGNSSNANSSVTASGTGSVSANANATASAGR